MKKVGKKVPDDHVMIQNVSDVLPSLIYNPVRVAGGEVIGVLGADFSPIAFFSIWVIQKKIW